MYSRQSWSTSLSDSLGGETWLLLRKCRVSELFQVSRWCCWYGANRHNSPDIYGSTESTRVDGTGVSALLTWDSKVTTVVAILGGVTDFVRQKMKADNVYDEFVDIIEVCSPGWL